jgi:serine/threonine-protein kinase
MATDKQSPPQYFGRYQVLEELGTGSMGVVYLCVDPRLARPVAIKVIKDSEFLSPEERENFHARFRNEVEAAGRLNHPGIVQIYDIGPSYFVMEFLEGRTLSALLRSGAILSVAQLCALVFRVADAIDHAHRQGIVHRDIKPANVMLLSDGGVKVLDFGVARLPASNLTAAGTVVGSVRYMSPEQMMGEKVDGRADVFSLAAVAYELLTGRAPFPGKTITEVVSRVVHGVHVPPRQVDERFPEGLNAVFDKAFAPRPSERFASALEFAGQLHQAAQRILELEVAHQGHDSAPTRIEVPPTVVKPQAPPPAATPSSRPEGREAPEPRPQKPPTFREGLPVFDSDLVNPIPVQREGLLAVDSDPSGARVFVDGNRAGQTPLSGIDVAFGRHVVRIELEGRETVSTEVELRPERPLKAVTITLPPAADVSLRPGKLVPFGPSVTPPRRMSGKVPSYPDAARDRGLEGAPAVEVWIGERGDVINVAVVESAGPMLDEALMEAVRSWRFTPAKLNGVPVSMRMTVQHVFRR